MVNPFLCLKCKGKNLCGLKYCPLRKSYFKIKNIDFDNFFGNSPPSIFVGSRLFYPNVNVGILSPPEYVDNAWLYDAQNFWADQNFGIQDVINFRKSLINSRFTTQVKTQNKFLDLSQEIAMSIKPVEIEVELTKRVKIKLNYDKVNLPMGPRAELKKAKITKNPKISRVVEKVTNDTDLKANEALVYLRNKNFDDNTLTKLLSIGTLGLKKNRKLVPTRWSITAVDDTLGKSILEETRKYEIIQDHMCFYGNFMGNHYLILMFPDVFSYELFEMFLPGSSWNTTNKISVMTDHEDFYGRKNYAQNTAGGYYAARISVLEYLKQIKKQASVLVFRFETPEYWAALGVWVVRNSAKKSLQTSPLIFKNRKEMLDYCKNLILKRFNFDISKLLKNSKLLENIKKQIKLTNFF